MPRIRPHSLPRTLYRRMRTRRAAQEENRFQTSLRTDPQAPELVLSPHFDDAVFDCWSLLSSDRELNVVNVCARAPAPGRLTPWDAVTGAIDSAQRVAERAAEDAVALARAGRKPLDLPFLDAQYRTPPRPTLDRIDRELCAQVDSASRVYVPAGLGSHPDHLLVRHYGRMLSRAGIPVTLYADLPYCVQHGWPHWVEGREPESNRNIDAFWQSYLENVPEMPPLRSAHVERLDEQTASAKLEAMICYRTQFPALNGGAKQLLSDPAIHGFEVRWELTRDGERPTPPPRG